ncbi:MAG: GxxExxY protein [bacterium]
MWPRFLKRAAGGGKSQAFRKAGLKFEKQKAIKIYYDGQIVGDHVLDLLVEGAVIVELKATKTLDEIHMAQCLNFLKATNLKICLLINFGRPRIQIKRVVNDF